MRSTLFLLSALAALVVAEAEPEPEPWNDVVTSTSYITEQNTITITHYYSSTMKSLEVSTGVTTEAVTSHPSYTPVHKPVQHFSNSTIVVKKPVVSTKLPVESESATTTVATVPAAETPVTPPSQTVVEQQPSQTPFTGAATRSSTGYAFTGAMAMVVAAALLC